MRRVFFDMDGTLNVWALGDHIDKVSAPGYMRTRTPIDNMVEASRLLHKAGIEVWILSSVLPYEHSMPDKDYWIDKHCPWFLPDQRIYTPYGTNKADFLQGVAGPGDVFLDDYTANLKEVEGVFGEDLVCVKVLNGINDTNHSWHGRRISVFSDAETLAKTIMVFAKEIPFRTNKCGEPLDPSFVPRELVHILWNNRIPLPETTFSGHIDVWKKTLFGVECTVEEVTDGYVPAHLLFDKKTALKLFWRVMPNGGATRIIVLVYKDGHTVSIPMAGEKADDGEFPSIRAFTALIRDRDVVGAFYVCDTE